jgi:hypothetical protein
VGNYVANFNYSHFSGAYCSFDFERHFSRDNRIFPFLVEDLNVDSGVAILGDWEEELLVPLRADRVLANLAVSSQFNSLPDTDP